jgi:8-oxo-dGTP pyrophosphatase MutT (NUDIX family)
VWRGIRRPIPPAGVPHGATGVCLAGDLLVLVSRDGEAWDLPAGRPEPGERPLRPSGARFARKHARLTSCALLGFSQGTCIRGPEQGLTLVRSLWRAEVVLDPWSPASKSRTDA